mgnify:CR=1 FL=1
MAKRESAPVSHNEDANIVTGKGVYGLQYSNGDQHWYLENPGGRNPHISEDAMLKKHGYGPKDFPDQELTVAMPEDYAVADEEPVATLDTEPVAPLDPVETEVVAPIEAELSEAEKEEYIHRLNADMERMLNAGAAFEETGKT